MKVSDYVIDVIAGQGVRYIYEMIGGAITHLIDSVHGRTDIQCFSMHHEQAAAFAAEGYARTSGRLGVAMATSGPGALNLLTGIGSCYFDSVPCLFITGQVNTYEYKFDRPVRQLGFQETDIVSIASPITKFAEMVTDKSRIRYTLEKAIYLATHGRCGPVLLDLPGNLQREQINPEQLESFFGSIEHQSYEASIPPCQLEDVKRMLGMLKQAERPLILAGGGVRLSCTEGFTAFAEAAGVPVVHSLMGLDALPASHPLSVGLIGSYGNRYANLAAANCDCLLVLGSRLDTRQTGTRPESFARNAVKIHVDVDRSELNHKVQADLAIHGDLSSFLRLAVTEMKDWAKGNYESWLAFIEQNRRLYPSGAKAASVKSDPNRLMERLSDASTEGDIIVLDVGQNQMWASQSFRLKKGQRLLNAGGMGAMGFALPAAIGAACAAPDRNVIVIAGDGGAQVNLQELHTISLHGLPIKCLIMNNRSLGMVRQFQDTYMDGRNPSTVAGYGCPDFVRVAEAFDIPAYRFSDLGAGEELFKHALKSKGPLLLEAELLPKTDVVPKLMVNRPVEDMAPSLSKQDLQSAMLVDLWEDG